MDIFQYSNMYMVTAEFPKLTADETVMAECGVYVTRAGFAIPDWPTLAGLYARLLPGRTVHEWSTANRVHTRGTDERRFVSFGVVKGFLRRVHRWPVIVDRTGPFLLGTGLGPVAPYVQTTTNTSGMGSGFGSGLGSAFGSTAGAAAPDPARRRVGFQAESHDRPRSIVERERVIAGDSNFSHGSSMGLAESPSGGAAPSGDRSPPRRPRSFGGLGDVSKMGRSLTSGSAADTHPSISSRRTGTLRSGTLVMGSSARVNDKRLFELEDELVGLLDGHHHADEIQVRLGIGWAQLEKLLGLDEIRNGVGKRGVAVVYK